LELERPDCPFARFRDLSRQHDNVDNGFRRSRLLPPPVGPEPSSPQPEPANRAAARASFGWGSSGQSISQSQQPAARSQSPKASKPMHGGMGVDQRDDGQGGEHKQASQAVGSSWVEEECESFKEPLDNRREQSNGNGNAGGEGGRSCGGSPERAAAAAAAAVGSRRSSSNAVGSGRKGTNRRWDSVKEAVRRSLVGEQRRNTLEQRSPERTDPNVGGEEYDEQVHAEENNILDMWHELQPTERMKAEALRTGKRLPASCGQIRLRTWIKRNESAVAASFDAKGAGVASVVDAAAVAAALNASEPTEPPPDTPTSANSFWSGSRRGQLDSLEELSGSGSGRVTRDDSFEYAEKVGARRTRLSNSMDGSGLSDVVRRASGQANGQESVQASGVQPVGQGGGSGSSIDPNTDNSVLSFKEKLVPLEVYPTSPSSFLQESEL